MTPDASDAGRWPTLTGEKRVRQAATGGKTLEKRAFLAVSIFTGANASAERRGSALSPVSITNPP